MSTSTITNKQELRERLQVLRQQLKEKHDILQIILAGGETPDSMSITIEEFLKLYYRSLNELMSIKQKLNTN